MFNKPYIPLVVAATILSTIFIFFMVFSLILLKKRQNRKNKLYLQSLLQERENAMLSVSMELHDNVNQMLQMARADMRILEDGVIPEYKSLAEQVGNTLNQLMFDTQNISYSLNPNHVRNIGFVAALQEKVAWLNGTKRIKCDIEIDGPRKVLPDHIGLMLLRIAQEAIQNVLKHAEAQHIFFRLKFGEKCFEFRAIDDGKGMVLSSLNHKKGIGIENMKQRAGIINGDMEVFSLPGFGASIVLKIPDPPYIESSPALTE